LTLYRSGSTTVFLLLVFCFHVAPTRSVFSVPNSNYAPQTGCSSMVTPMVRQCPACISLYTCWVDPGCPVDPGYPTCIYPELAALSSLMLVGQLAHRSAGHHSRLLIPDICKSDIPDLLDIQDPPNKYIRRYKPDTVLPLGSPYWNNQSEGHSLSLGQKTQTW
jgi:hypothetical protein